MLKCMGNDKCSDSEQGFRFRGSEVSGVQWKQQLRIQSVGLHRTTAVRKRIDMSYVSHGLNVSPEVMLKFVSVTLRWHYKESQWGLECSGLMKEAVPS